MLFAFDNWPILIIPAIGFVVWLVSMLFRNATEPPKKNAAPRPPREAQEPRRQTSSDLDRFISEARRQRETEERRAQRPPQRRPVMLEEVEEEPRPRPIPRPPMARPPVTQPRPMPPRPVVTLVPVARPALAPVMEVVEATTAPVMQALTQTVVPDQPMAPVDMLKRETAAVSPLLLDIQEMLKTPKSAQLAFALREIFDLPLCRRRHR